MAEEKVEIFVNGEPRRVPVGQTVSGLLTDLELNGRLVVVELNRQILRRGELPEIGLESGDRVELVNFVGGG
ncbi:MAG: sulfur carrier protein ThiS [Gemmatimonadetes bacterium]|jgi:thiamine biosynthesis protein ThiS|nr:sulfur carrier protein ThiS [Gemmatimonadota bacterium]MCZ6825743.1 sulfur carrier protein ThiS [Gemmatimonadota bacterium]